MQIAHKVADGTEDISVAAMTTTPYKKEPEEPRKRPERIRPSDSFGYATHFLGQAILYCAKEGKPLTTKTLDRVKPLFRNFAANIGLRGKQKESVWRIVKAQIVKIKEAAPKQE